MSNNSIGEQITTRFSGADWYSEQRYISIIGVGGIGSWLSLNLSRVGHHLTLIDGDVVDVSNVSGGQMYRTKDIGKTKVSAVHEICREFGCIGGIEGYDMNYDEEELGSSPITICGLDNMKARKEVFEAWIRNMKGWTKADRKCALFMDGRLLMESMEIFTIRGDDKAAIEEYQRVHLFNDSEVGELDCTTKQSTFAAMTIAGLMTATLCNWLTNIKLNMDFREVNFHTRLFLPIMNLKKTTGEVLEHA